MTAILGSGANGISLPAGPLLATVNRHLSHEATVEGIAVATEGVVRAIDRQKTTRASSDQRTTRTHERAGAVNRNGGSHGSEKNEELVP